MGVSTAVMDLLIYRSINRFSESGGVAPPLSTLRADLVSGGVAGPAGYAGCMGGRELRHEHPDGSPMQPGEPGPAGAGTPAAALPGPTALERAGHDGVPAATEPAEAGTETEDGSEWGRRRREILDAAAEVFFLRGFDRGTTKEV